MGPWASLPGGLPPRLPGRGGEWGRGPHPKPKADQPLRVARGSSKGLFPRANGRDTPQRARGAPFSAPKRPQGEGQKTVAFSPPNNHLGVNQNLHCPLLFKNSQKSISRGLARANPKTRGLAPVTPTRIIGGFAWGSFRLQKGFPDSRGLLVFAFKRHLKSLTLRPFATQRNS